jgi:decaprenylphospho-beta-D-erythro-pentofuranosid-2-ulose 2-reductase
MLAKQFKNVVLVGANSDIGISIINHLPLADNAKLYLIGRTEPSSNRFSKLNLSTKFEYCDLENLPGVKEIFNDPSKFTNIDLVIIAAGYLPNENLELDLDNIEKTIMTNSLASIILLSGFVKIMNDGRNGQILVLSSVASIRPRIRNFTYGASKATLDFYSIGIQNKFKMSNVKISIARPGFVFSKMTSNFRPAPFAIDLEAIAKILVKGLLKEKRTIYAPRKLKVIMGFVKFLPRSIFNKLG